MASDRLPFALLVLFAFLTPFISPAYVAFGLLLLAWAGLSARRGRVPESLRSPLVFLLSVLAGTTVLSAVLSTDPGLACRHLWGLSLFLLVPITMDLVDRAKRARSVFLAIAVSGIGLALLGIWQYAHGGSDLENRIRGTLSHYMTYSGLMMIAGCLLLGMAFEGRGPWRLAGLLSVLPLVAVLLTFTRGAYVGMVTALVVYAGARRPRALLVLAPVLLVLFLAAPPGIRDRIRSIADVHDPTNRDRIAMVHAGLRMVRDRPVLGLGPEMVQRYYPLYRDPDAPRWTVPHLHNNTLQIAAANGLFAAAAYLALLGVFFARVIVLLRRREERGRAALWAGALLAGAALSVAGLFEYNFGDTEVEMATLLVLAVPFSGAARRTDDATADAAGGSSPALPRPAPAEPTRSLRNAG
jgi:putative inorganic carbon (HCO3(-)) transporter